MHQGLSEIFLPDFTTKLERPLVLTRVCAGFPSPAEDYIEGRIDLNRDLIQNDFATFYFRMDGDSMKPLIKSGVMLIVDRMVESKSGHVIVARTEGDLFVRVFNLSDKGKIILNSINPAYKPIEIDEGSDFEVFGSVIHAIQSFNDFKITPSHFD